jgi:pilus assembly protein Flp/PilA
MKYIYLGIKDAIEKFSKEDEGVTAIEYGLIAAATAVAIIAALGTIKTNLSAIFTSISTAL